MIAIDITTTQNQYKNRGIGIFTKNIVEKYLESRFKDEIVILAFNTDSTINLSGVRVEHIGNLSPLTPLTRFKYISELRKAIIRYNTNHSVKITKLFSPFIHSGTPYIDKVKTYVFVHDMIQQKTNSYSTKSFIHNKIKEAQYKNDWGELKKAKHIITNSNSSKKDIIEYTGLNDISVVYLGIDHTLYNPYISKDPSYVKRMYDVGNEYILYYGGFEKNKNVEFMVNLFNEYIKTHLKPNLTLAIVGNGYEKLKSYTDMRGMKNIKYLGFLDDTEKVKLIINSLLYINLSSIEGFGLSVLENIACGIPVLISQNAVYKEMFSSCGYFISLKEDNNKTNIKTLNDAITNYISREHKIDEGLVLANNYSWEKCFQGISSIINND